MGGKGSMSVAALCFFSGITGMGIQPLLAGNSTFTKVSQAAVVRSVQR